MCMYINTQTHNTTQHTTQHSTQHNTTQHSKAQHKPRDSFFPKKNSCTSGGIRTHASHILGVMLYQVDILAHIHAGSGGGGPGGKDSNKGKLYIIGVVDNYPASLSSRPLPLTKYAHLLAILTFSLSCPTYVCKLCMIFRLMGVHRFTVSHYQCTN